jgi:glycerol kinase
MRETTALGAALAAGLSTGVFRDISEFQPASGHAIFEPKLDRTGMLIYS